LGQKKNLFRGWVKGGLAFYLLQVKSMLGSGQSLSQAEIKEKSKSGELFPYTLECCLTCFVAKHFFGWTNSTASNNNGNTF